MLNYSVAELRILSFGYGFVSPHKLSEKNKATWEGSLAKDFINYS